MTNEEGAGRSTLAGRSSQALRVVAAVIVEGEKVLLSRRLKDVHLAGSWEFPGGKVEAGESDELALTRELNEELGLRIEPLQEILAVTHDYRVPVRDPDEGGVELVPHAQTTASAGPLVELHFWSAKVLENSKARALQVQEFRWAGIEELERYGLPEADRPVIAWLLNSLHNA